MRIREAGRVGSAFSKCGNILQKRFLLCDMSVLAFYLYVENTELHDHIISLREDDWVNKISL